MKPDLCQWVFRIPDESSELDEIVRSSSSASWSCSVDSRAEANFTTKILFSFSK